MTGWRWLASPEVEPGPGALEALEDAARARPDARLVASVVVTPSGEPDGAAEPWPELFAKERAIEAAAARLLAVRAVHAGSLLVREDVLAEHGEPPAAPWGADLAWSAAVLAAGGGYLAPRSTVTRAAGRAAGRVEELRGRARLVRLPGLTPVERLWLVFLLLRRATARRP